MDQLLIVSLLRNSVPSSGLHIPWPPMVSTTEISVSCVHVSSPPPMGSYGLHLGILKNPVPIRTPPPMASCGLNYWDLISISHGLLWFPPWHTQKPCAFTRTPPPMASYGLHCWDLRLILPISHLHLPRAPMVSTLAYSETLCLHQDSTSHGLLWSPLLRSQFACAHVSTPTPMGSYGIQLGILRNYGPFLRLNFILLFIMFFVFFLL
jgi:hypothetical protein